MLRALLFLLVLGGLPAGAAASLPPELAAIDREAMSGEPERIKAAIESYLRLDTANPEIGWRLTRAYFNYYDELAERNQRREQAWAAENGYAFAKPLYEKYPEHPELVYYYGVIALCYLDFNRMRAVFLINHLFDIFEKARRLAPRIDDGGPDRNLAILYHEVPGWPLGRGDKAKALAHIEAAVQIEPRRAANRIMLAKFLAGAKRYDEGWRHIQFIRAGDFKVSSPHWHAIYMERVEEVALDFPRSFRQ
jgi:hypothetical protein